MQVSFISTCKTSGQRYRSTLYNVAYYIDEASSEGMVRVLYNAEGLSISEPLLSEISDYQETPSKA